MKNHAWLSVIVAAVVVFTSHTTHSDETTAVGAETAVEDTVNQTTNTLRTEYLELVKIKAELMQVPALQQEIATTKRKIDELRARQRLTEAEAILQKLADEFPESEAAEVAAQMLAASRNPDPNNSFSSSRNGNADWDRSRPFDRSSAPVPRTPNSESFGDDLKTTR